MKNKSILITVVFLFIASNLMAQVTDKDGNTYKTAKVNTQEWMLENLDVSHFRNGDIIPEVEDSAAWDQAGKEHQPAWCYFNSDPANGKAYGKLYNWYAVNDSRGLAPEGWHIPTDAEWTEDSAYIAGSEIKFNENGFTGLTAGGYRDFNGKFAEPSYGAWWSSSESNFFGQYHEACSRLLDWGAGKIYRYDFYSKSEGLSIRCIRN